MHQFMTRVSSIVRSMRVSAERGMAGKGIGFPEQMVLMCLYPDKTCNQDAIARMLDVDKGAVARTVLKLEEKGLIERAPNPQNRRENLVRLGPSSAAILDDMRQNLRACSAKAFKGFSDDERDLMMRFLGRIADNLRAEDDE